MRLVSTILTVVLIVLGVLALLAAFTMFIVNTWLGDDRWGATGAVMVMLAIISGGAGALVGACWRPYT